MLVKSGIFLSLSINIDRSLHWCCWSIYKIFFFSLFIDYFRVYFHLEISQSTRLFCKVSFSNVTVGLVVDRIALDINEEKQIKEGVLHVIDLRQIFRFFCFFLSYIFLSYSPSLALPVLLSTPPGETNNNNNGGGSKSNSKESRG